MLILGDEGHYHGRFPWVTASLIVINVVVFVAQVFIGEAFTNGFSLVPEEITTLKDLKGTKYQKVKLEVRGFRDEKGKYQRRYETKEFPIKHYAGPFPICLTLFTSMFLHADLFHLIGNMWFLLVFGRNVECALNHGRFLAFYTGCGLLAGLAHVASSPHSLVPCLGASGAISGVLGAYVSIHPLNKVKIWLGWLFGVVEVPALVVIGIWFLLQYVSAILSFEHEGLGGVAYWNHLGGFTAGFLIIRAVIIYLRRQEAQGALAEEEPLIPPQETLSCPMSMERVSVLPQTGIKAGDPPYYSGQRKPDPIDTFLAVQPAPDQPSPRDQR